MVRAVFNGLFGVGQPAALPSSSPVSQLPKLEQTSTAPLAPTAVITQGALPAAVATPVARMGAQR
jgi:hypothetical protein